MKQDWRQNLSDHESVSWLLRHIGKLHRQAARVHMAFSPGQEPGQPVILMTLQSAEEAGRSVSQNDLAQLMHVSDPTITASLKSLERQGYISREPDPNDMRRKLPVLTPLGEQAAKQSRRSIEYVDEAMLGGLTPEEVETLSTLLQRVQANLRQMLG